MKDTFSCPDGTCGRADKLLADYYSEFSRAFIRQAIEHGEISRMDGTRIEPKTKIQPGDQLVVSLIRPKLGKLKPYPYKLKILHEDDHLVVINKSSGMVVHPGDGTDNKTLVHALLHHCPHGLSPLGEPLRPGIVHRLDKETSGVMVVAKSELAHLSLADQFASRQTSKLYQAIVSGKIIGDGECLQPIGRHPSIRVKMSVSLKGKPAKTSWKSLKTFADQFSLIQCKIMTGRTHQIRVHLSAARHPLAGDKLYGFKAEKNTRGWFPRVMLHAWKLNFEHPVSKQSMDFEAQLPVDFLECLDTLEQKYK